MSINMRRGLLADFDPGKMTAGEWAVSIDPESENQIVWMCFAPGIVKRMGTYEDFRAQIAEISDDIINQFITALTEAQEQLQNDTETYIQGKVDDDWVPELQVLVTKAEGSASNAADSAKAASASEANAEKSASAAKKSEDNTAKSETAAGESAKAASDAASAAEASKAAAAQSAENAAASESSAEDAATRSAASAKESAGSASAAKESETAAKNSETKSAESAAAALTSEQNAAQSADEAAQSKTAAAGSASAAKESETAAGRSADSASASASAAETSETNAEDWSLWSKSYAVGETEKRPQEATDNAKYYYEQAKRISQGLEGSLLPMGTITFSALAASPKQPGYMYNIKDAFVSDDTFADGGNHQYGAGSNVYCTADGMWDVLAAVTVTGVKGSTESTYRQGNVEITKAHIGLSEVPNVSTNNQAPTWTVAAENANIASGEKMSVIMGKIAKWRADLKNVAFSGNYNDLDNKPTTMKNPAALKFSGASSVSYDGSTAQTVNIPVSSVNTKTGAVTLTKADVGLGSVDNTADSAKNVSHAKTADSASSVAWGNVSGKVTYAGSAVGLVPARDTGSTTNKYLREDGKWVVPPDTNTWNQMKGATASAAGGAGYVPAPPASGYNTRYLRADGSWEIPPDHDTKYTLPVAGASIGGVKSGTDISVDANGNVSVVNDSHTHQIGNVTGLQSALDGKLATTGNGQNVTVSFTNSDVADASATSWTTVTALVTEMKLTDLFTRMSQMFKNVRYLYKQVTELNGKVSKVSKMYAGTMTLSAGNNSARFLYSSEINTALGITNSTNLNTAVFVANGDGKLMDAHMEGATYLDGAWWALFDKFVSGTVRLNYFVIYWG